ncbi:MAG: hypothetical protein ACREUU_01955 [Gammaproteobacteria bacterium]
MLRHGLIAILICAWGLSHAAGTPEGNALSPLAEAPDPVPMLDILAADTPASEEETEPLPGSLLLPDEAPKDGGKKQCMTVCARWGEECMLVNKGRGGLERKCRRTCKQFAEECF